MNRDKFIQELKSDDIWFSEKERQQIIQQSLNDQHWKLKCTIVMEELAELQQQVSKQIRGCGDRLGLLEEIADAYICLNLLRTIFDIKDDGLQKAIDIKFSREKERLKCV